MKKKETNQDDLVIEGTGGPAPSFPVGPGKIIFQPEECPDKAEPSISAYKEGQVFEFAPADPEALSFNYPARERLERQISDLMAKINQSLRERNATIRDALDVLEMARTTTYTEPLGEVSVALFEAARRLTDPDPKQARVTNRLGNLALEIRQSEEPKKIKE